MRTLLWYGSLTLIALGLIIYLSWSILYDAWTDVGVYSISIPLILFGVFGALLSRYSGENQ